MQKDITVKKIEKEENKSLMESLYEIPVLVQVKTNRNNQFAVYWFEKEKLIILLVGVNKFPYMDKYGFIAYDNIKDQMSSSKEYLIDCAKEI